MSGGANLNAAVGSAAGSAVGASVVPVSQRGRYMPGKSYGLRARAWWVMRERRKFTLDLVLETVASGVERDARSNLLKYLGHLERCGVLVRSRHRQPGESLTSPGHVVWIVARDVGRLAPVWRSVHKVLWDPNSQTALAPLVAAAPVAPVAPVAAMAAPLEAA